MSKDVIKEHAQRLHNDLQYAAPEMWLEVIERRMADLADDLSGARAETRIAQPEEGRVKHSTCRHCRHRIYLGPPGFSKPVWRHLDGDIICIGVIYTTNGAENRHLAEPLTKDQTQ